MIMNYHDLAQKIAEIILMQSYHSCEGSIVYGVHDVLFIDASTEDCVQLAIIHNLPYLTALSYEKRSTAKTRFSLLSSSDILFALGSQEYEQNENPNIPELEELVQMPLINRKITEQGWVVLPLGVDYIEHEGHRHPVLLRKDKEVVLWGDIFHPFADKIHSYFLEELVLTRVQELFKRYKLQQEIARELSRSMDDPITFSSYLLDDNNQNLREIMDKEIKIHVLHLDVLQSCSQQGVRMRRLLRRAYDDATFWDSVLHQGRLYDLSAHAFTIPLSKKYPVASFLD